MTRDQIGLGRIDNAVQWRTCFQSLATRRSKQLLRLSVGVPFAGNKGRNKRFANVNLLGESRVLLNGFGPHHKGRLGYVGETQARRLQSSAEKVGGLDQDVHAIRADQSDEESGEKAEGEAGIAEGHRHREYTRAQTTLEQMYERVEVRCRMGELAVLERVVKGSFLVGRPIHER